MKIHLLGDIAFTGILSEEHQKNPYRFKEIAPILQNSDFIFANLEVPVRVSQEKNEHKNFIHYSIPQPTEQLLKLLNIGCVSLANNHIYDCKMSGLKATIELLDKLGVYHTGAGWKKEHVEPLIIEKEGLRIAFLAYVDFSTNPKTESFPGLYINYFDVETVKNDIASIRKKVDKVVCSLHWGVDYSFYPTPKQRAAAKELIDAGVDIIMGHHPHTIQPYEKYNGGCIFYSLGTFVFGDIKREFGLSSLPIKTKKGIIACFELFNTSFSFKSFKIKKNNFIQLTDFDYKNWSNKILGRIELRKKYIFINVLFLIQESFVDRLVDFFWGYYKKPFKTIFTKNIINKLKNSVKEYFRLKQQN